MHGQVKQGDLRESRLDITGQTRKALTKATLYWIRFRSDVKKHLSVPFRNAIFKEIFAT